MEIIARAQHRIRQQYSSSKVSDILCPEPQLWILVNNCLAEEANSDLQFWWKTTGVTFAILLQKADYTVDAQCQSLLFYYYYVVPELGPGPNSQGLPRYWKSFMTDHFCPVEFSWEWGYKGESPTVRFSFEPIGPNAGEPGDPFNQFSSSRLVHQYQHMLPNCDLRCFDHFSKELLSYDGSQNDTDKSREYQGHESRCFVAFDFGKAGIMLKAYFLPVFKAAKLRISTLAVICEGIKTLPEFSPSKYPALCALEQFLTTSSEGSGLEAELFAIDCVAPAASRFKIYMRSRSTGFHSVQTIMGLGGAIVEPNLAHGLEELLKLWNLVLGQETDYSPAHGLQQKDHRTAGIVYYFDIRLGQVLPGIKVYLPVQHYGHNDLAIAEGLSVYLKGRGQGPFAHRYIEALKSIS